MLIKKNNQQRTPAGQGGFMEKVFDFVLEIAKIVISAVIVILIERKLKK